MACGTSSSSERGGGRRACRVADGRAPGIPGGCARGADGWLCGLVCEARGQATTEAAVLVPVVMLLLALLLQPAIMLYVRTVMGQAAAEGTRVLATREAGSTADDEAVRAFVVRRLSAVPDTPTVHVGGEAGWEVPLSGDASSGEVSVEVAGSLRPLPLLGVLASAFGESRGEEVVLRARAQGGARPAWLEGSYGDWVSMWG